MTSRLRAVLRWALPGASLVAAFATAPAVSASMTMGQNLDAVEYWTVTPVFANSFKAAKMWSSRSVGGTEWDSGYGDKGPSTVFAMRTDGYPTVVPYSAGGKSQFVHTQVPVYENGVHRFSVTGKGKIRYSGPGISWVERALTGGTVTFDVTASGASDITAFNATGPSQRREQSYWYIEIRESQSADPVRDIRIMRPGYNTAGRDDFDNDFKGKIGFYPMIRFMDWQRTNNNPFTKFNNTNGKDGTGIGKDYYSQATTRGVSIDHIVDLANQTSKNIWVCVPHSFTNQGMNDMAYRISRNINSGRLVLVEYSNEVWNGQFQAYNWVNNNVSGTNHPQKTGTKCKEVFTAFKSQFDSAGKGGQLRRMLAGQAANDWILSEMLKTAKDATDHIAIAPYFGTTFGSVPNPLPTLDQLDDETYVGMASRRTWLDKHNTLAKNNGKSFSIYEGGQHFNANAGAENNEGLTDRLLDFNRDWRMRNVYRYTYLGDLNSRGVSNFVHFSMCARWTKWGSWGSMEWIKQTIGQNANDAQKEWALRDWKNATP